MKGILNRAAGTEQKLELIYITNENQLSQRVIKVLAVTDYAVKAYCYNKRQFRTFKLSNILSIAPYKNRRSA